jgi:hypothetical protein
LILACALACAAAAPAAAYETGYYDNGLALFVAGRLAGKYHYVDGPGPSGWFAVAWNQVPPPVRAPGDYEAASAYAPTFAYFGADGKPLAVKAAARAMDAGPFADGRARVLEADREALYGYIDPSGAWAIPPRFAEAADFSGGRAAVREPGGKWGAVGPDGAWLVAPGLAAPPAAAAAPPADPGRDPLDGYSVEYVRQADWGPDFNSYALRVSDPAGRVVSDGVFNSFGPAVDGLGVVAVGRVVNFYGYGYGASSCAPDEGAYGLYDLKSGRFLVPLSAAQVAPAGAGLWYVRPHSGAPYLFDARKGKNLGAQPTVNFLAAAGPVVVGYALEASAGGLAVPAVVNDDKVRLRSAPSTAGAILGELNRGAKVTAVEYQAEVVTVGSWTGVWTRVELEDGRTGWMFGYFLDYPAYRGL